MIWVDWGLGFVVLVSAAVGAMRGFVRELLGLAGWALALGLSWTFADDLAVHLESSISLPSLRLTAAAAALFAGGLVVGALVAWLVGRIVQKTPFATSDRLIGAGFGTLRGVAFAIVFVLLAGLTPLKRDPWWQQSLFIGKLEWLAGTLERFIPGDWTDPLDTTGLQES